MTQNHVDVITHVFDLSDDSPKQTKVKAKQTVCCGLADVISQVKTFRPIPLLHRPMSCHCQRV